MNIDGKVAIVTGGASGLGAATAELLVAKGAKVALFDVNDKLGEQTASSLNGLFRQVDVTSDEAAKAAIDDVAEHLGGVHFCINCAGIGTAMKTVMKGEASPLDAFKRVIDINLVGTFNVLRHAAAQMLNNEPEGDAAERGVIVNTASIAAFDGQMGQAAYSASKAGVVGMSLPIARDFARDGVRINVIAPGLFETPLIQTLSEQVRARIEGQVEYPKRFGMPKEYASTACHILENPYINGECIRLDAATRLPPR
ncbi:MAG: SDR family NAD(P)-dependent oxidoreductase [Pseudomonadota bacterium]